MTALCVLTGDLVASSDLSPEAVDHALTIIETAATDMAGWNGPDGLSRFARRGGDSWQIALADPSRALRAALFVQACLRRDNAKSQTRIALATGTGALPIAMASRPQFGSLPFHEHLTSCELATASAIFCASVWLLAPTTWISTSLVAFSPSRTMS